MTLLERALRDVNKIRKDQGREPLKAMPKGLWASASNCPIARAIGSSVGSTTTKGVLLSKAIQQFISKFDSGGYPELDDSPGARSRKDYN